MSESCVFCDIVAGIAPAVLVSMSASTVTFRPLNPVTPGHLLIVPRVHVADAATDPTVTAKVFWEAAQQASENPGPFNLITSAGPEATQTVFHLHVHYVPRVSGDDLHLPWTNQGVAS